MKAQMHAGHRIDHPEILGHVGFRVILPTVAEAEAFAANFPKSRRLSAGKYLEFDDDGRLVSVQGMAYTHIVLAGNAANRGVNETGAKRCWALLRDFANMCIDVEWTAEAPSGQSYRTMADFLAVLRTATK